MSVAGRYIRSDLKINVDVDATSANTLGVDIADFTKEFIWNGIEDAVFRTGFNISNIGPRLKYDEGAKRISFLLTLGGKRN